MNVLIIRLSSIGDIFHTFTVLPDIKNTLPNSSIDWLVDENFVEVAKLSPLIDNVIAIPLRKWKKNKFAWIFNLIKFKQKLNYKKYDYIIDTQGLIKSAFLAKYLFVGKIYGLDFKSAREWPASLFYSYKYRVDQNNIAVIRLRGLIAKIFNLNNKFEKIDFRVKSADCGLNCTNKYIVYLHGTSRENKKWELKNWLNFSQCVLNNTQYQIVLTYSNDVEQNFANLIIQNLNSNRVLLISKLDFLQLTDLIMNATLVVGVDTGFTHLANLLNIPTLAIYLNSNPEYVGMLESAIAHNFGGMKQNVQPEQLIEFIKQNNLL